MAGSTGLVPSEAQGKRSDTQCCGALHHFELSRHADPGRHAPKKRRKKDTSNCVLFRCDSMGVARRMVEVAGLEPTTSWSRTKRATNCATPRYDFIFLYIIICLIAVGSALVGVLPCQHQPQTCGRFLGGRRLLSHAVQCTLRVPTNIPHFEQRSRGCQLQTPHRGVCLTHTPTALHLVKSIAAFRHTSIAILLYKITNIFATD